MVSNVLRIFINQLGQKLLGGGSRRSRRRAQLQRNAA